MHEQEQVTLIIEVKDGWIEVYIGVPTRLLKILIAIITAIPAVTQLLSRYPQIAAIVRAIISGS